MQCLAEREKIIQREQRLLQMKEEMAAKERNIRRMEQEVATRNAALTRYDHDNMLGDKEDNRKVVHWLETQCNDADERGMQSRFGNKWVQGPVQGSVQLGQPYRQAMALANDTNLASCRTTGVSRLDSLGLSQSKLRRVQWSEPVLGAVAGEQLARSRMQQRPTPVIGRQDDGESIISHHSRVSLDANKSDVSASKKTKVKSGMYDKIADDVVMKLKWLHKKLDSRWVSPRPLVHQMLFEHVVAGEIAVIMRSDNPEEVRCRLHILQKLAYWNLQGEGWPRVREIYVGILQSLEEGEAQWTSTFDQYDMVFSIRQKDSKSKPASKPGPRPDTYWCRDYNRTTCSLESGHKALVAGKEQVVSHICVVCWKNGKREKHPETDSGCPHKEL